MNIENEIFLKAKVNFNKLLDYGFQLDNNIYVYQKKFLNEEFEALIYIDKSGKVTGKVIDLNFNIEYTNIRTNINGEFVNKVRDCYKDILIDIKNKCFDFKYFIYNQSNSVATYIYKKYSCTPEFLWDKFKGYGVFRNSKNNKWFGIIMNIDRSKIDNGTGEIEILNVKLKRDKIEKLLNKPGFYKSYHMNSKDWISIILDQSISDEDIFDLIDQSYDIINI